MADGGGLCLLVSGNGKYWRYNYQFGGKRKMLAPGGYPDLPIGAFLPNAYPFVNRLCDPGSQEKFEVCEI